MTSPIEVCTNFSNIVFPFPVEGSFLNEKKNVGKGNSVRPAHFGAWILSSRPILTLRSELHQWWTLSVQEFPLSGDNGALGVLDPRVAWNQANCEAEHLSKWWVGGGPGGPPGHRAQRMHTSSKGWALALVWPGVRAAMISSDCKQMWQFYLTEKNPKNNNPTLFPPARSTCFK